MKVNTTYSFSESKKLFISMDGLPGAQCKGLYLHTKCTLKTELQWWSQYESSETGKTQEPPVQSAAPFDLSHIP